MTRLQRSHLALALGVAISGAASAPAQQPFNNRQLTVQARIVGDRQKLYDGSFQGGGRAGICGVMPKEIVGEDIFVIEFAPEPSGNQTVTAIAFGSKQLVGTVTKATVFRLSMGLVTANGGRPPSFVINTDTPHMGTGEATLSRAEGVLTLTVKGQDDLGAALTM